MRKRNKELLELKAKLLEQANVYGPDSPEFRKALKQIIVIDDQLQARKQPWLSPDTILTCATTIGVTVLVLVFERNHAFTGKSFNLIRPPRT